MCTIEADDKEQNYRICRGLVNEGRPTSELTSHLMNFEVKKLASDGKYRVIYYAHTTNVIALMFVLPLNTKALRMPSVMSAQRKRSTNIFDMALTMLRLGILPKPLVKRLIMIMLLS